METSRLKNNFETNHCRFKKLRLHFEVDRIYFTYLKPIGFGFYIWFEIDFGFKMKIKNLKTAHSQNKSESTSMQLELYITHKIERMDWSAEHI